MHCSPTLFKKSSENALNESTQQKLQTIKKQETQNKINIKSFKPQTITYNMWDWGFTSAVAILYSTVGKSKNEMHKSLVISKFKPVPNSQN